MCSLKISSSSSTPQNLSDTSHTGNKTASSKSSLPESDFQSDVTKLKRSFAEKLSENLQDKELNNQTKDINGLISDPRAQQVMGSLARYHLELGMGLKLERNYQNEAAAKKNEKLRTEIEELKNELREIFSSHQVTANWDKLDGKFCEFSKRGFEEFLFREGKYREGQLLKQQLEDDNKTLIGRAWDVIKTGAGHAPKILESGIDLIIGNIIIQPLGFLYGVFTSANPLDTARNAGAWFIENNRQLFLKYTGSSAFGTDEEFSQMKDWAAAMALNPLGHIGDTVFEPGFEMVSIAFDETSRSIYNRFNEKQITYQELKQLQITDPVFRWSKNIFHFGEATGAIALLLATQGGTSGTALARFSRISKMLGISSGMSLATATAEELLDPRDFQFQRFVDSIISGTAQSLLFMGGMSAVSKGYVRFRYGVAPQTAEELALLTPENYQKMERVLGQAKKITGTIDFVDGHSDFSDAMQSLDRVQSIKNLDQLAGALMLITVSGFDVADYEKANYSANQSKTKVQFQDNGELEQLALAELPAIGELSLAKLPSIAESPVIAKESRANEVSRGATAAISFPLVTSLDGRQAAMKFQQIGTDDGLRSVRNDFGFYFRGRAHAMSGEVQSNTRTARKRKRRNIVRDYFEHVDISEDLGKSGNRIADKPKGHNTFKQKAITWLTKGRRATKEENDKIFVETIAYLRTNAVNFKLGVITDFAYGGPELTTNKKEFLGGVPQRDSNLFQNLDDIYESVEELRRQKGFNIHKKVKFHPCIVISKEGSYPLNKLARRINNKKLNILFFSPHNLVDDKALASFYETLGIAISIHVVVNLNRTSTLSHEITHGLLKRWEKELGYNFLSLSIAPLRRSSTWKKIAEYYQTTVYKNHISLEELLTFSAEISAAGNKILEILVRTEGKGSLSQSDLRTIYSLVRFIRIRSRTLASITSGLYSYLRNIILPRAKDGHLFIDQGTNPCAIEARIDQDDVKYELINDAVIEARLNDGDRNSNKKTQRKKHNILKSSVQERIHKLYQLVNYLFINSDSQCSMPSPIIKSRENRKMILASAASSETLLAFAQNAAESAQVTIEFLREINDQTIECPEIKVPTHTPIELFDKKVSRDSAREFLKHLENSDFEKAAEAISKLKHLKRNTYVKKRVLQVIADYIARHSDNLEEAYHILSPLINAYFRARKNLFKNPLLKERVERAVKRYLLNPDIRLDKFKNIIDFYKIGADFFRNPEIEKILPLTGALISFRNKKEAILFRILCLDLQQWIRPEAVGSYVAKNEGLDLDLEASLESLEEYYFRNWLWAALRIGARKVCVDQQLSLLETKTHEQTITQNISRWADSFSEGVTENDPEQKEIIFEALVADVAKSVVWLKPQTILDRGFSYDPLHEKFEDRFVKQKPSARIALMAIATYLLDGPFDEGYPCVSEAALTELRKIIEIYNTKCNPPEVYDEPSLFATAVTAFTKDNVDYRVISRNLQKLPERIVIIAIALNLYLKKCHLIVAKEDNESDLYVIHDQLTYLFERTERNNLIEEQKRVARIGIMANIVFLLPYLKRFAEKDWLPLIAQTTGVHIRLRHLLWKNRNYINQGYEHFFENGNYLTGRISDPLLIGFIDSRLFYDEEIDIFIEATKEKFPDLGLYPISELFLSADNPELQRKLIAALADLYLHHATISVNGIHPIYVPPQAVLFDEMILSKSIDLSEQSAVARVLSYYLTFLEIMQIPDLERIVPDSWQYSLEWDDIPDYNISLAGEAGKLNSIKSWLVPYLINQTFKQDRHIKNIQFLEELILRDLLHDVLSHSKVLLTDPNNQFLVEICLRMIKNKPRKKENSDQISNLSYAKLILVCIAIGLRKAIEVVLPVHMNTQSAVDETSPEFHLRG